MSEELTDEQKRQQWQDEMELIRAIDDKYVPAFTALHRSVIDYSLAAIRATLLLNGGGAVALLSFMAAKIDTPPSALLLSLGHFVSGALLAAITAGTSYVAQTLFVFEIDCLWKHERERTNQTLYIQSRKHKWTGHGFQVLSCALFITALAAFVRGCFAAFHALAATA